jgi:fatty acid desaturase
MDTPTSSFSIRQARGLVKDLSTPKPLVYWSDFLGSILAGHAFFGLLVFCHLLPIAWLQHSTGLWTVRCLLFVVAAVLYLRSVLFIHELVHLPTRGFAAFRLAWNALCGIPMLIPSFLYYPHVEHHRRKHYGTKKDGEYIDLSHRHPANLLLFVGASIVVPLAAIVRFAVMTPLAWLLPGFRNWMEQRASSMIIDIFYLRGDYGRNATRVMRWQETMCCGWCWFCLGMWLSVPALHAVPYYAYAMAVALVALNNLRTLGAHRWVAEGGQMTFEEQLLDSLNYPNRPWITELWGPIGIRYHALHHLFPSLPYHNLGTAHRRLMAELPADSIYRQTERSSLTAALLELYLRTRRRTS